MKGTGKISQAKIAALAARLSRAQPKRRKARPQRSSRLGPVSLMTTAPVAMGNSVRGAKSVVRRSGKTVTIVGRDFMFTPIATQAGITTWSMVGGTPMSPVAFADSNLRQYCIMYQKYRWKRCTVHYITSSPTSSTGDVMFYFGKNRDSVFLNQTSSLLLPFVISDENALLGPQWTNHSTQLNMCATWKSTDYGMAPDPNEYADGELFLLSKTTTTDSPGYVLFDYEIEFDQLQLSPRLLTLPIPRAQYWNAQVKTDGAAKAKGGIAVFVNGDTGISGSASAFPPGAKTGDIYKIIFDITNSTFTTGTAANMLENTIAGVGNAVTLSDGFTCYAVFASNSIFASYSNVGAAYSHNTGDAFAYGATLTYNVRIQVWMSLVGTVSTDTLIPNY